MNETIQTDLLHLGFDREAQRTDKNHCVVIAFTRNKSYMILNGDDSPNHSSHHFNINPQEKTIQLTDNKIGIWVRHHRPDETMLCKKTPHAECQTLEKKLQEAELQKEAYFR
jgi:hypothetical protein